MEPILEPYVIKLDQLGMEHVENVGGKNASLGEMIGKLSELGVRVPGALPPRPLPTAISSGTTGSTGVSANSWIRSMSTTSMH